MPYPIALAHKLSRQLTKVRKDGTLSYLRPDGKTQVTVEYDENGKPDRLDAVVLSTQHDPEVTQEQIHEDIKKYVFDAILPQDMVDENTKFFINPTGRFVIGGPHGDSGLTGRKIIVDTYGDLRPAGIIKMLDLRRPIYKQTAAYGHFGRNDLDLPWEKLDKAETLKKYL